MPFSPPATHRSPINWLAIACYAGCAAIVLLLFYENFLFSEKLGRLASRTVDDLAFQLALRDAHTSIASGQFSKLWILNYYAYGWLYWAPLAWITYPLYLISSYFGIDWPLIVVPRQVSLLFALGGAYFLRKIVKRFTQNEAICATAALIYLLFPAIAFFSMRFGTVTEISFLSILSAYLLLRDKASSFRALAPAVIVLAAAGAVKLSGLLIAPFLFLIIVRRLIGKPVWHMLGTLFALGSLFVATLILLTNPALLAAPFHPQILHDYLGVLKHHMQVTQVSGLNISPWRRFYEATFHSWLNATAMFLLRLGLVVHTRHSVSRRFECLAALITLAVVMAYLIFGIKSEVSAGSYFTAVSFLIAIGVIGWQRSAGGAAVLFLIVALLVSDVALRVQRQTAMTAMAEFPWNHATYLVQSLRSKPINKRADFIENCIAADAGSQPISQIFYDYEVAPPFNALSMPNTCFSVAWGDLSPAGTYCDRSNPIQYILLSLTAPGFMDEAAFNKRIAGLEPSVVQRMQQDRSTRTTLAEQGLFGDQKFVRLCSGADVAIFKAKP
ncbi:hypothetical protein [Achromobacter sp. AONIH1]|uniref:hypothetical protein n=1 Tax=Achromobacter sp. AONIH1 TaxID=1758194 RepID=UPI00131A19BD|nr:hypothetical protein [Achromobacter sp. AONIH1]